MEYKVEELDFFGIDDNDIDSICLNCGLEEEIPAFIYDEMGKLITHKELNNKNVYTIYCNNCEKLKVISKNILKNSKKEEF